MIKRIGVAAALLVPALGLAGPAASETLFDALATAYATNPDLEAERAQLRATDEGVPQALSGYRPTITGTGQIGKSRVHNQTGIIGTGRENRTPRSLAITISQPIFRGFRTLAETRSAEASVRAGRANLVSVEQQVMLSVIRAYMDVVTNKAVVDLRVNNVQFLQRELEATQDRFEVGEVTRTDVSQGEARLSNAEAERMAAEGQLSTARAAYARAVGQQPVNLEQPDLVVEVPTGYDEALAQARGNNPDVLAAYYNERASRQDVNSVEGELLPSISLNGELSRGIDTSSSGSRVSNAEIVAQLTVPFYQAGATTSRLRQAKQVVAQRRQQIHAAMRLAEEDVASAWSTLRSAQAQVRSFEAAVEANEIALSGVREEERAGLRTLLDVLDAEQELLDAQVGLVSAQRDVVVASYQLWAAMGWLTAENIGLEVPYYDPEGHYDDVRLKPWGLGDSVPEETSLPE